MEGAKGLAGAAIAFSFTFPEPIFSANDEGTLEGVFEPLPVKQEVVFLAERGSCC